uniref:Uncharacterized protein n=1 Tax=Panagrolaimus sp. JU765 TaxID=591449 RepID=A0AC34Q980_9BILA
MMAQMPHFTVAVNMDNFIPETKNLSSKLPLLISRSQIIC